MKIMAVDYGDAHTGIAVSDVTETLASPLTVIHERGADRLLHRIAEIAAEHNIEEIVVGNPINMNNTRGPRSERCEAFAERLREAVKIPVTMWDERSSTVSAHNLLGDAGKTGKKRKAVIDAAAAAVILESYLAYRRNKI
jgi:putative Holliday junction resolvase